MIRMRSSPLFIAITMPVLTIEILYDDSWNILQNAGNKEEVIAFMFDRNLPIDEIEAANIADEIQRNPPIQGFLTISNALQWRLQYGRVIERAGQQEGIISVYKS